MTEHTTPTQGYRVGRTLPLRVEFARQLRRRRTQLAFGFLFLLPWILVLAFAVDTGSADEQPDQQSSGLFTSMTDIATTGAVNFAVFTMFVSTGFLLVVVAGLFFGDTVASEANWSSLRYLLAAPVPRMRLLRQKLLVALAMVTMAVVLLPLTALLAGAVFYGLDPLVLPLGGPPLSTTESLGRLGLIVLYALVNLLVVSGTAFALTVATDSPLGAVGGAVGLIIMSNILEAVDALGAVREFLPAYWSFAWADVMLTDIPVDSMIKGAAVSVSYALILFAWAFRHFSRKDVVS
ncbi:ABC transporter permease [Nocardiopsis ansamitocini]|uniref:ABC transporter permease n=1 Tax=Nocardiopsis ansamitocini TaxID=1670832 RepID=A0A9W6P4A9_9ACTN|nr:ABC transporter permease subunit [Nocardiopsis ansamitocini]GLU46839.1 ABC transporter permease [Nocardiopsis ansamitocini]